MAQGTLRPDSDLDVLVVVDPLPSRPPRHEEFRAVEQRIAACWLKLEPAGVETAAAGRTHA